MVVDGSDQAGEATPEGDAEVEDDGPLLRPAMIEDGQPPFPLWLPAPGVLLAVVWALYQGVTAEEDGLGETLSQLLWPGIGILLGTTIAAYLGWRLDLD